MPISTIPHFYRLDALPADVLEIFRTGTSDAVKCKECSFKLYSLYEDEMMSCAVCRASTVSLT